MRGFRAIPPIPPPRPDGCRPCAGGCAWYPKPVGVLEHCYILYQQNTYLVAVAVDTLLAILDSRNYQEGGPHSLAEIVVAVDSHGPVGQLGMCYQCRQCYQRRLGSGCKFARDTLGPTVGCMAANYRDNDSVG